MRYGDPSIHFFFVACLQHGHHRIALVCCHLPVERLKMMADQQIPLTQRNSSPMESQLFDEGIYRITSTKLTGGYQPLPLPLFWP
jgi:hypothetical protein